MDKRMGYGIARFYKLYESLVNAKESNVRITNLSTNHSNPIGSRFEAVVHAGSLRGIYRIIGFVLYEVDLIIIHDPYRKKQMIPLDDYNDFDGDFLEWLNHIYNKETDQ